MPLAPLRSRPDEHTEPGFDLGPVRRGRSRRPRRTSNPESRRPLMSALGVLVVLVCALLGAEVAAHANHRSRDLAVATYVPQGAAITAADLTIVSLTAGSGVSAVPSSESESVLGRRASEPLEPGSLLVPDDLTAAAPLPAGDALVGTSLANDQAPAGLTPGDSVLIVLGGQGAGLPGSASGDGEVASTPSSSTTGTTPAAVSGTLAVGTVYAISLPTSGSAASSSDSEIVTLEVPRSAAALVTAASAVSDISLAQISEGPSS
ncbi:MAG: SAF domain-containing protein [Acidimicrobiales bacterium]